MALVDVLGYGHLMREAFIEVHRVLKPGRWVTVVFHNSHNAVWFTIQGSTACKWPYGGGCAYT